MSAQRETSFKRRGPTENARYILLVDRQAKRGFDAREEAEAEARRILERFPNLNVRVEDSEDRTKLA